MNIMYLSLYGVAAVVLAVVFIRTCLERDKMTRIVCLTEMLALICVVTYSVNFITDNYMAMSVATSIMMAAQDFALVALLTYTGIFTRLANRITRTAVVLCIFAAMVDSVVFIINIFNETALKYSLNKCGGVYVLGYEGEFWFGIHAIMNMVIVAFIIALLIIKCIRIPSAYWGRYIFTAAGLIVIIAFKYIFIMKAVDLRFDISIFLYALMGTMVYWNTFWYSKKNMLTVTHEMIIEHMQIPVVLFDYEGILADFNSSMKMLQVILNTITGNRILSGLSGRMTCLLNLERIHLNGSIMTEYMTAGLRDFQMKKPTAGYYYCYAGCVGVKEGLC